MNVTYGVDPETDSNRHNPEPHWRLYHSKHGGPGVACLQDFDYPDYDPNRFMTAQAYSTEEDANLALGTYLFRARALHNTTADERLSRALVEIDRIATALNIALEGDADRQCAAEATLRDLRTLQRDLIR
jgi:hypothetical protein